MARQKNQDTAIVRVFETEYKKGVRFNLRYSYGGKQYKEVLTHYIKDGENREISLVPKSDKVAYNDVKQLAFEIAKARQDEIRRGQLGYAPKAKAVLLTDWMYECANDAKAREEMNQVANRHTWGRTIENTIDIVKKFEKKHLGKDCKATLADVDEDFLLGFIKYLRTGYVIGQGQQNHGKHLAASTAQKRYQCLCFAMKKAQTKGYILTNPCDKLEDKDKIKVSESTRAYLTIEELKRMEDTPTASEGTRQAYLFMCYCGLRISDVKALRWADIDQHSEPWTIAIQQQKTQETLYLPLSSKARQYMPLRGDAAASDLVFASLPTEPAMNRTLKAWAERAGIEKNLTLHTARHTYATTLLTKGADLYTVSKLLGHSEVATTQIYAKIVDKKKVDAVNLLNEL